MSPSLLALLAFIAWTLALLLVMEAVRATLVLSGEVAANGFDPANSTLSPFMQRLARAHLNCLEGLPVFGGLLLLAQVAGFAALTDPLAWMLVAARVLQSTIHLVSVAPAAVTARFVAFCVQLGIAAWWVVALARAALG